MRALLRKVFGLPCSKQRLKHRLDSIVQSDRQKRQGLSANG
jgi:hypothetical protein